MLMAVNDPFTVKQIRSERSVNGHDKYDEVWDGVYVVFPPPNDEQQELIAGFILVVSAALGWPNPHHVRPGINLSDRVRGWKNNFREPDFVIFLDTTQAKNCGTHWVGGPDFLVEIVSPHVEARDKLPFYAQVGTKEVLIIDRDPWKLELYQLQRGKLRLAGTAKPGDGGLLESIALPLTFSLEKGKPRPRLFVRKLESKEVWKI